MKSKMRQISIVLYSDSPKTVLDLAIIFLKFKSLSVFHIGGIKYCLSVDICICNSCYESSKSISIEKIRAEGLQRILFFEILIIIDK